VVDFPATIIILSRKKPHDAQENHAVVIGALMDKNEAALEALPHLCKRVCAMWNSLEFDAYINSLVMDSRDGERKGLPMAVGAELLWLQNINKLRRALGIQERLGISLRDALAKVQMEDEASKSKDVWGVPGRAAAPVRRIPKTASARPPQKVEKNLFGTIFAALASKYTIFLVVAALTLKALWPNIKVFFE